MEELGLETNPNPEEGYIDPQEDLYKDLTGVKLTLTLALTLTHTTASQASN